MRASGILAAIAAVALLGAALGEVTKITVPLRAQNGSGESGTATLTQKGKDVLVSLQLNNAPKTAQPAHIHAGTCAKLNPSPKYPLKNVANGKSVTTIHNLILGDLTEGEFSINVHKSTTDLKTYVACGFIRR
jgi:Cu/Zn superoxide dismutase